MNISQIHKQNYQGVLYYLVSSTSWNISQLDILNSTKSNASLKKTKQGFKV